MNAIVRLVLTYHFGAPWLKWFSLSGLTLIASGAIALAFLPQSLGSIEAWCLIGVALFFLGSSAMPLIFGSIARSRQVHLLPYGRFKLLISAFLTTSLMALPLPVLSVLALTAATPERTLQAGYYAGGTLLDFYQTTFFWQMFIVVFLTCTWLYVALWFAISSRTMSGSVRALLVLIAIAFVPPSYVRISPDASLVVPLLITLASWAVLSGYVLTRSRFGTGVSARLAALMPGTSYAPNRALDLMLGTTAPWVLAGAQFIPLLLTTRFIKSAEAWLLFYLTIFSTVSGAIAGGAALRSRSMWLRTAWSRAELFARAEQRFWRHNSFALGVLLFLLIAIAVYSDLPRTQVALGIPLLILGTATSTYLGLMMTRDLRWADNLLAVGVMVVFMATAILASATHPRLQLVFTLQILLAATAIACRIVARRRWMQLDWMLCRANLQQSKPDTGRAHSSAWPA
jgi:hypothetical protein